MTSGRGEGAMRRVRKALGIVAVFTLVAAACTKSSTSTSSPTGSQSHAPVTITVWDYYGKATPFQKSTIQAFEAKYPWITVDYQSVTWDNEHDKFTVVVSSGAPPDVATVDMTWLPTFASNGLFEDLGSISGGQLNGQPIESQYTPGALDAMKFDGNYITMMFDFDTYALYYRSDVFKLKNIAVPKTWADLQAAAKAVAEDTNGDGKCDKYCFEVSPDTFHWSQPLFQSGGALLNSDNTQAAFNSPEGLAALQYDKSYLDAGSGILWGTDQGDPMAGVKSGQIGMFQDGPYWMGLLHSGAPEMKGKWAIATAPYSTQPGSYLGGTGLSIPTGAAHPQEAWLFIQYMLEPQQQVGVYTYAGAAPATTAALQSPDLQKPDPYFGGEAPFSIFLNTMSTATHFPYVGTWDQIDTEITNMETSVMLNKQTAQAGLSSGADKVNAILQGG